MLRYFIVLAGLVIGIEIGWLFNKANYLNEG